MVKVRALINFNDYEANVYRNVGDVFECTEERAEIVSGKNKDKIKFAEIIERKTPNEKEINFKKRKDKKIDIVE